VLKNKEHRVFVEELAESSVVLKLRFWCRNEDYWDAKWRMNENVKYALDEAGISIPYNQLDVHLQQNPR
jgi:small conductance mechanosensitive channel